MQFDYDWEPGEHDSRARRWVRRIAFVLGLVIFMWVVALVGGGDAHSDGNEQLPQTSSTYMPSEPFEAPEWNSDKIYLAAGVVDLAWRHAINAKRSELCDLMKTGYRERAVRSLLEGEDAYERSFKLDEDVDWYFAAQLMEVKCMRRI